MGNWEGSGEGGIQRQLLPFCSYNSGRQTTAMLRYAVKQNAALLGRFTGAADATLSFCSLHDSSAAVTNSHTRPSPHARQRPLSVSAVPPEGSQHVRVQGRPGAGGAAVHKAVVRRRRRAPRRRRPAVVEPIQPVLPAAAAAAASGREAFRRAGQASAASARRWPLVVHLRT